MRRIAILALAVLSAMVGIAGQTGPASAQEALYNQRGSLVKVTLRGAALRIVIEDPGVERAREGARRGDVLFTGKVSRNYAEGMAWTFHRRCGNVDYHVYGDIRIGRPFTLAGTAPVYGRNNCRIVDNVHQGPDAVLPFMPARAVAPRPPAGQPVTALPAGSAVCVANVSGGGSLNLRTGPGANHPAIATLRADQCGATLAGTCRSGWCPVKSGDDLGWASSDYLARDG